MFRETLFRWLPALLALVVIILMFASGSNVSSSTQMQQTATADPTATRLPSDTSRMILATTTSTYDSGLLDYILPVFEKQFNVKVDVVSVGSGQAFQLGQRGDADVLLVHARDLELKFVQDGYGTKRYDVMYNDFVIIGPPDDPAKIKGLKDAVAALTTISKARAKFISRGDNSGTDIKEHDLWKKANIEPKGDWYISAGQGMGAVLTMANEQLAYTLSDRSTYVSRLKPGFDLAIMVEGDPDLRNPYSVIPVNPARFPNINTRMAQTFADWLISVETQKLIASFQINNQQLFFPDSDAYRESLQTAATATDEATTSK